MVCPFFACDTAAWLVIRPLVPNLAAPFNVMPPTLLVQKQFYFANFLS